MSDFYLEIRAYEVLGDIHVEIKSREIGGDPSEPLGPISLVQVVVQGPTETDRRAWLQDALVAALEAL